MDEIKLELAFKDKQFSGIVVGGHLIEDGEVVDHIKELEENNEGIRDALNLRKGALVQATNGIKQLNERIKELEEGIKKHKDKKYGLVEMRTGKIIAYADFSDEDKELYKLIEKKKL